MTVSSELNRKEYAGNGVTTAFGTSPVVFFDASDLEVYDVLDSTGVATLKTITTDYTVSGGAGSTGTVTMLTAPASGHTLVIVRSLPLTQADDFVQNDASDAEVVEDALDRQTMIAQQLQAQIDRAVKVADSDITGVSLTLPNAAARALMVMGFDADGGFTLYDPESAVSSGENVSFLQSGTGAVARAIQAKGRETVSPEDFGCVGDGVTDDTANMRLACGRIATGGKLIGKPGANYLIHTVASTDVLYEWAGVDGVELDFSESTITNDVSYTASGLTDLFKFSGGCKNIVVDIGEFVDVAVSSPATNMGDHGMTMVQVTESSQNIKVKAHMTNGRHGVHSGDYDTASLGYCSGFDIQITGSMVGYPVALYLANNVKLDIDVDGVHRAAYLAGCWDVTGDCLWKDQYGTDSAVLITDSKTGTGTSRGCRNVEVSSTDKGSTVYDAYSVCASIGLQRVDPGTIFENIKVRVHSYGDDGISTTVGGFRINSAATTFQPSYPFDWESTIYLRNIKVSGVVDHSTQTKDGNSSGDLYLETYDTDASHAATVENLVIEDFVHKPSAGQTRDMICRVLGATGAGVVFKNLSAPSSTLEIQSNTTVPILFENAVLSELSASSTHLVKLVDSKIATLSGLVATSDNVDAINSRISGSGGIIKTKTIVLSLSGASTGWSNAIPGDAMVLGVSGRVLTEITGASGFQVGVTGTLTRYADEDAVAAGTTFGPGDGSLAAPVVFGTGTLTVIVTAKTSNFTGGTLRLVMTYLAFPRPTS